MSLPEIGLVLEIARRDRADEAHAQARAAFLASAGKWSDEAFAEYNELLEDLADRFSTVVAKAKEQRATRRNIASLFGAVGLTPPA